MEKAVVVLTPNGRRQTVKVNVNSTILQIIEEVCRKQGLKPEEYDIKHHNKCLDVSTIIRFSGLPNNAQLELSEATQTRSEGIVTVGLQLENGTRLTDSFNPNTTLSEILAKLCPEEMNPEMHPVVIYMRRETYGEDALKATTLRTLGLTNGRAMLRLIHRTPEQLHKQANVSAPLPSRPTEEQPYVRRYKKVSPPVELHTPTQSTPTPETSQKSEAHSYSADLKKRNVEDTVTKFVKDEKQKREGNSLKRTQLAKETPENTNVKEKTLAEEDFVFLDKNKAMIFSQQTAEAIPTSDLPEDFFELTITDAKKLLRDIKKRRLELENAPLQTAAVRNLLQSTKELSDLNKYKQAVIRVIFPNQTVLQGVFNAVDSINTILKFVREYLQDKSMSFYLYTTPPKNVLEPKSRLFEVGCVPNAILHFGTKIPPENGVYLRLDLMSKFTTASLASLAAAKTRQESTRVTSDKMVDDDDKWLEDSADSVNVGASTSTSKDYADYPQDCGTKNQPKQNLPKWFKPGK
ncbi:hypothetical protein FQA39_LY01833 [Lamprigera yunnana]|nr:hypothetical protein FQA39_LY01833 [Lamprigera yunnana]